ncbi:hypothetical protein HMPREF9413_1308 [Paenibacillus sp. HGF7]|nr:hypothetical protein HMPREF9413_1308 [Paenibacillus sp. HGF7]
MQATAITILTTRTNRLRKPQTDIPSKLRKPGADAPGFFWLLYSVF